MSRKPRARDFHNRVAERYDSTYDSDYWDLFRAVGWELLKPHLPRASGAKVLDLGCGTGHWGLKLAKSGFHATFVDESAGMLEVAARKAADMGLEERCRFVQADLGGPEGSPLAAEAGTFALAVAEGNPLSQVRNLGAALAAVRRLLAPDAVFAGTVNNLSHALDHFARMGDPEALREFVRTGRTLWLAHDKAERFEVTMYAAGDLRRHLERAGFQVEAILGRGVLPLREHPAMLAAGDIRQLVDLEVALARDPSHLGRASQLEFVARLPGPGT